MSTSSTIHPKRQKRRLPRMQRTARLKHLTFWPTYGGALEWLRRHQVIIDTALSLLDIYPSLIQESALDQLWNFLMPFVNKLPKGRPSPVSRSGNPQTSNDNAFRGKGHSISGRSPTSSNRSKVSSVELGRASSTTPNRAASSTSTGRASHENNNCTAAGRNALPVPNSRINEGNEAIVPVISITYASDETDSDLRSTPDSHHHHHHHHHNHQYDSEDDRLSDFGEGKIPRVYVSCLCNHQTREHKLHRHVLHALQHEFYVRSGPCAGNNNHQTKSNNNRNSWSLCEEVLEADACVFVLDDLNLNSPHCFQSLCAARVFDIPTVFLKDSSYSLPTMLPDIILQHNLGLDSVLPEQSRASTPSFRPPQSNTLHRGQRPVSSSHILCARGMSPTPRRLGQRRQERTQKQHYQQQLEPMRDSDMVLHLLNGYRNALVFEDTNYEDCEEKLKKKVQALLGIRPKEKLERGEKSSSVSNTRNSLHPLVKRSGSRSPRFQRRSAFLGVPKSMTDSPWRHGGKLDDGLFDDDDDDDGFEYPASSPSEMSISLSTASESNVSCSETRSRPHTANSLSPEPLFLRRGDGQGHGSSQAISRENVPSPLTVMLPVPPNSPPSTSTRRSSSGRPFSHLQQLKQQLQQDRATFLSSVSPMVDEVMISPPPLENFEGRQTTYLVCSKSKLHPNREPRLVKWPPSPGDDDGGPEASEESDSYSDSPASSKNYRDIDLSMLVNKPRGSDTPDSDASIIF